MLSFRVFILVSVNVVLFSCIDGDSKNSTQSENNFVLNVEIEDTASYDVASDGDLWPAAWSDDGNLYTANGDGKGIGSDSAWVDIVVNKLTGHPENGDLRGERITSGNAVGTIWNDTSMYNRKPTGMLSEGGILYLAVQDLGKKGKNTFNEAPSATIVRSNDKGKSWTWDKNRPMFDKHVFTTVFFLDYGQDGKNNVFDDYVYAYGLDSNWRDSFSDIVGDPVHVYLARIPKHGIQNRDTWEFYTGDLEGNASWSAPGDINAKRPVLTDTRRIYQDTTGGGVHDLSVISQGSVVYNKPLDRYIYTSWTEFTFEFYEAPKPWGPWKLFVSKDFGRYKWTEKKYGGYGVVIPSKFISDDGRTMWMSSSTFAGGVKKYNYSMRKMTVRDTAK